MARVMPIALYNENITRRGDRIETDESVETFRRSGRDADPTERQESALAAFRFGRYFAFRYGPVVEIPCVVGVNIILSHVQDTNRFLIIRPVTFEESGYDHRGNGDQIERGEYVVGERRFADTPGHQYCGITHY